MARAGPAQTLYDRSVFINCPFDTAYLPIFRALVFAIISCGLKPRCALEVSDAAEVRFEKIVRIIGKCRWGIHDISRTEPNPRGLPRFNMPLELGLFLGARRFGDVAQRKKSCLVLDREPYRYQEYISDNSGQDIAAHRDEPHQAMRAVRDWLATAKSGVAGTPGIAVIAARFVRFQGELPAVCAATERRPDELTFVEYADIASEWLRQDFSGFPV